MTRNEIIEALAAGEQVTVPYHVEGYGPGRACHSWGEAGVGAVGPEGYLTLAIAAGGRIIIDPDDEANGPLRGEDVGGALIMVDGKPVPGGSDTHVGGGRKIVPTEDDE